MKIALISFTRKGAALCRTITDKLIQNGHDCFGYTMPKFAEDSGLNPLETDLSSWTKQMFEQCDGLVFVSAAGIAVRAIAPYIKDKTTDPAVIFIDEQGRFAVSLLSGHIGKANDLALEVAMSVGATPVVSTATDINLRFAVDSFAVANNLYISSMKAAKAISAELLDNKSVGLHTDFELDSNLPNGIVLADGGELGICISLDEEKKPFIQTLNLIPKIVSIGIGCKKSTPTENIEQLVRQTLSENNISIHSIKNICSIDIKANEQGILDFCGKYNLNFDVYSSEMLSKVEGTFTASEFVKNITGVDNVCERAAVLGSDNGRLIVQKIGRNSATIAIAVTNWRVSFEH